MLNKTPIISIAPMLRYSDRHFRYFMRCLSKHVKLYTEMITTGALIHGDKTRFLKFDMAEHPVAIQLGGSDPEELKQCSKMSEDAGFDEINLNVGCPSERVQSGRFGACLMAEPDLVAESVSKMKSAVKIPVTVKTRIGIDHYDNEEFLWEFIKKVSMAGCKQFIIHARKAWLKGLSPKENRDIPPLCYERVYKLKKCFPQLDIVINGGIKSLEEIKVHLHHVDGVMLGRAAYENPYLIAHLDKTFWDAESLASREEIIERWLPYVAEELKQNTPLALMSRHVLNLFRGEMRGKFWRRHLTENAHQSMEGVTLIKDALKMLGSIRVVQPEC